MDGYGLVLSGGGAKGSYEIGVWQALRDLGIPIKAVTGTSVGALNGAMITQGEFALTSFGWCSMSVEYIINIQKDLWESKEMYKKHTNIFTVIKNALTSGGLDITPLIRLLKEYINEDKVRKSPIDLGLVTFSLSDFKPLQIFKEDIPKGKLVEYLVASACFPAFKPIEIDNKKFIDGGIYDNVPISLMASKGIKDIIVVDITGFGTPTKKAKEDDLNIITIKSDHDLGRPLEFNPKRAQTNIDIGYADTMKVFGIIKGKTFYIANNPIGNYENSYAFDGCISIQEICEILGANVNMDITPRGPINNVITDKMIRFINRYADPTLDIKIAWRIAMAEITAEQLEVDKTKIYTLQDLNEHIIEKYYDMQNSYEFNTYKKQIGIEISKHYEKAQQNDKPLLAKLRIDKKFLPLYLSNTDIDSEKPDKLRRLVALAYPKTAIASIYLYFLLNCSENKSNVC
ncbi:patatin-like phospholipase family protein [Xylanivirga thermophila]|uniref:patatin-like phospholipase family protein n=1 Tax=Xylanivirga thermophila TaxID=2496273 RepID=UPI0013EB437D|nr:patatin-like phospholipase family protein [Xylanivirga thermophila]